MTAFAREFAEAKGRQFETYEELHRATVEDRAEFWGSVWDWAGIRGVRGETVLAPGATMRDDRYFPDARLNFAENLLCRTGPENAIVFRDEAGQTARLSWDELAGLVARLQAVLDGLGIGQGDRVAAMLPNVPETVALMLAAASRGVIFASCSPDFGATAVTERFGQIEPALFVGCDGYHYAGKARRTADVLREAVPALAPRHTIILDRLGEGGDIVADLSNALTWADALAPHDARRPTFTPLPFDAPLYILFSSGTTGAPKCICHGAGGTLIQHLKEHRLHCGVRPGDRFFYFTTCAWMMWNWLASALGSGATLLLYDGSPFHPSGDVIFDYLADERATFFGTSAKFIEEVQNRGMTPKESHDLSALRMVASTGSPLSPAGFSFVYDAIAPDVDLASIAGGTDIVSCFVLGVPWRPVYPGEIQGPGLGMAVDVWTSDGTPVRGQKGELVCVKSFPSMPIKFWGDENDTRYRQAYFDQFDGVWAHGDLAEWTETGGIVIHGRSDATLNPQGVRIGTGEIYAITDTIDEIDGAVCVGQSWKGDERVILFIRPSKGVDINEELADRIRRTIRERASPRHVPAKVLEVDEIPRTRSGKITELAVKAVVNGDEVPNRDALQNPEALEAFRNRPELRT